MVLTSFDKTIQQTKTFVGVDLDQMTEERPCVLIVEDDPDTTFILKHILRNGGFNVLSAASGAEAIRKTSELKPHLILLDLMMPEMDGWETLDYLRQMSNTPVIIISALGTKDDIVKGFQQGVDDYIAKPFYNAEVVARVQAVLRRVGNRTEISRMVFPGINLTLDRVNQEVTYQDKSIELTPKEFSVLAVLAKAAPAVVNYQTIASNVWGVVSEDTYRRIKYLIYLLRQKFDSIDPANNLLINVDRLGYKLRTE
ncbi:MAG: response regulator transcription factor [Anaerolineaceae bacterium]|jgi:DNA-binding response OmpR family regulator